MKPPRSTADWQTFIRDNTKLLSPPLVPEIKLHLAEESLPIWQKTEEELGEMNIPPPYWAFAWAGGQALARYLLDNPAITRGQKVLDLGSGSGLTAIAARMAGAQSALATDIDEVALIAVGLNAAANSVAVEITAQDLLDAGPGDARVILAGDLFYERALATRMLTFIDVCTGAGATVLVGDPQRSYFPRDRFEAVAEYRVPVTRELEDTEIKNAAVWRLRA
jgi:predicted nicotinamide N-methyase